MQQDLKTKLISRKIKEPNPLLMSLVMWILGILNKIYKVEFSYDYDPDTIQKQPTVLLSSHASRLEFIYTLYGFRRKDVNMICGYQNILQRGLYPICIRLGVISKYLYQPDFVCVRNMLRVLRRGGAIGVFPEGIQSTSGSTHPINPATAQFIKRSKANIVVCTTRGAYLATNRYASDRKKGYIGVSYSLLFTPPMLEQLSVEQIYALLLQKISYNDFAFNKVARHAYIGKKPNAYGIDKILYKCPDCKEEHVLYVENDTVICKNCGLRIRINEYYDLVDEQGRVLPTDIDEWYKWQRRCVAKQVQNEDFELTLQGSLCTLRTDKLKKAPKNRKVLSIGTASLTGGGLRFAGMLDGQKADFEFDARSLYSLTCSTKGYLEFYYHDDYFMLVPEREGQSLIQWTLAAEEAHNLYDADWKAASADVYDYEKGDILWASLQK